MVGGLGDGEASPEAAVFIADDWFLLRSAEGKVGIQQPGRSTVYIQLARAHPHFDAHDVRFIEFDSLGNVEERPRIRRSGSRIAAREGRQGHAGQQ